LHSGTMCNQPVIVAWRAREVITQPVVQPSYASAAIGDREVSGRSWRDYWSMTKPEVNFLVAITTASAFYMASAGDPAGFPWIRLVQTFVATVVAASGAAVLNQWMEHPFDAKMRRTARRAIAAGRVEPTRALIFGAALSLIGVVCLAMTVNPLASVVTIVTLVSYLLIYTPLKRHSPLCTAIGGIPGALPPVIGWAAARGHLDDQAWVLFAIVFLWQFPHFMAIAWMYRDDYDRAGYKVLPHGEWRSGFVSVHTLLPLLVLPSVSLVPALTDETGIVYRIGAILLGAGFFHYAVRFALRKSGSTARQLLIASVIYLPALLALMIVSRH